MVKNNFRFYKSEKIKTLDLPYSKKSYFYATGIQKVPI